MSSDLYVLEWSQKQGATHVQPFEKTMSVNRLAYRENKPVSDYIPLAIGSRDDMLIASESMRQTLVKRSQARPAAEVI